MVRAQWGVFIRAEGPLVSYTRVVQREGTVDDHPASIGGVGGIATHPDHRGKGYVPFGMGRALDFLAEREADFALLVCRDELVEYYSRLGLEGLRGGDGDHQFSEQETFTFNRVMVGDVTEPAPRSGPST